MLRSALILCLTLAGLAAAHAEPPPLELAGANSRTLSVSAEAVSKLPAVERDVTFATSKGPSTAHYKGVLVWDLLKANDALGGLELGAQLGRTFVVSASDGYRIAFSIGEIHPEFGNLPLILVTAIDGKPLDQAWRLVAPGDKRGARAVRDVVRIELK